MERDGAALVAIIGGRGGVGKSHLSLNLALALGEAGLRITLLDTAGGDADAAGLSELLHANIPPRLLRAPALENLDAQARARVEDARRQADVLLWEGSPPPDPRPLVQLRPELVVLLVDPRQAAQDAFTALRRLLEHGYQGELGLLFNRCGSSARAVELARQFRRASARHFDRRLHYLGRLPEDPALTAATLAGRALLSHAPDSPFALACRRLAGRLQDLLLPEQACAAPLLGALRRAQLSPAALQRLLRQLDAALWDGYGCGLRDPADPLLAELLAQLRQQDAALAALGADAQALRRQIEALLDQGPPE